jgi:hypothetical protein
MTRPSFSSIAAATLLLCFASAPVNAQNAQGVSARWGYNANGFFMNGPKLTGIRSAAVLPGSQRNAVVSRVRAGNTNGRYNVFRDRSGFGLRQTGLTLNPGWGCPACGFKNGPELSGLREPTSPVPVTAVTLPSGDIIGLR